MPVSDPLSVRQRRIVWTCVIAGGLARLLYVLVLHPATNHVYSDMQDYMYRALGYFASARENITDTVHPPGTLLLFATLHRLDPSWTLLAIVQWLLSLGVMALVWLIARRLYDTTTAVVALVLVSLYFPLIHYAGLFLSENPFTFSCLLAFWLFLLAIDAVTVRRAALYAGLAGLAAGLAVSFKNSIFAPLLFLLLFYVVYSIRHRRPHVMVVIASAALGMIVLMLPMSLRCTRLNDGHFCPAATNLASNVLIGHYGEKGPFYWSDRARNTEFMFGSPSAALRGYREPVKLDFGVYDFGANIKLAWQWTREHPGQSLRHSLQHVYDLFSGRTLWPAAELWGVDWGAVYQPLFWLFILLPASARIVARARPMLRLDGRSLPEWLLLAPLLGLMATVFVTIGEVRYRVPFDGLLIVLAARTYVSMGRRISTARNPAEARERDDYRVA